jgi:oligopeptide transport system substrate-binding protein
MSLSKKWRLPLLVMLALAAMLAFSACSDDDDDDGGDGDGQETEAPASGERQQGGTMTVQSNDVESMDPHYSAFVQDISLHRMIWRGLYSMDIDNQPQPAMADGEPQVSEDGTVYTVAIKEDANWSDGNPVVAEDFVKAFKRTCNPNNAGQYQYLLDASIPGCHEFFYAGPGADETVGTEDDELPDAAAQQALEDAIPVRAVDDKTVEITLAQPQVTWPIIMSLWLTFPVPSHLERFANETASEPAEWGTDPSALVYNGPYILQEYTTQDRAVLVPNPEWTEEMSAVGAAPVVDELIVRFIDNKATADDAFRNDELDEADADNTVLPQLEQEFGDEYFLAPQPGTRGLQVNLTRPPLDNEDVRVAISKAIDRETLNEVALGGAFVPTTTWLPEALGGEAPDFFDDQVGYDPEGAQELLANAGFPNGEGFPTFAILVRDSPDRLAQAEFLQRNFKEILNIDTTIEVVDSSTRSARLNNFEYDLAPASGWTMDYPDPENFILGLFQTNASQNQNGCSNPEIDRLTEEAQFNTNNDERYEQYKQINEIISTTICGYAVYYHEAGVWLISDRIVGLKENSSSQNAAIAGDWAAEAWGLRAE